MSYKKGLTDQHAQHKAGEKVVAISTVHGELATAGFDPDRGNCIFTFASCVRTTEVVDLGLNDFDDFRRNRLDGGSGRDIRILASPENAIWDRQIRQIDDQGIWFPQSDKYL